MRPCSPACVIGLAQINSRNFSAGLDVSHTDSLRLSTSDAQTSRPVCRSVSSSTRRVLSSGSACRTERPETPLQVKEKKQNGNAGRPEVSFSAWRLRILCPRAGVSRLWRVPWCRGGVHGGRACRGRCAPLTLPGRSLPEPCLRSASEGDLLRERRPRFQAGAHEGAPAHV